MVNLLQFIFGRLLVCIVIWLLLFPASWVLLTPIILIGAAFTHYGYWESVKNAYRNVTEFWAQFYLG